MIFDTHCHLNSEDLYPNIDFYIENAKKVGVTKFLVVGWNMESSLLAIKIAKEHEECCAAVGFHPTEVYNLQNDDLKELKIIAQDKKVLAIGEIGLDYHWENDKNRRDLQGKFFIEQIKLANQLSLPIIIHNRDAFEDCLSILKNNKPIYGGIMHCYSGSAEALEDVLDLGLVISLGGPLTFTNAKKPKEVCEKISLDKLVFETDSPYLSPHPLRGTINEPANIALVIDEASKIKNISKKHLLDVTYKNSLRVLKLDELF